MLSLIHWQDYKFNYSWHNLLLIIFPMSLVLRLLKIDLLHAKYENSKNTYRIQSTEDDSSHFEKPF